VSLFIFNGIKKIPSNIVESPPVMSQESFELAQKLVDGIDIVDFAGIVKVSVLVEDGFPGNEETVLLTVESYVLDAWWPRKFFVQFR
jgi:hypothetical protein